MLSPLIFFLAGTSFMLLLGVIVRIPLILAELIILEPIGRLLSQERIEQIALMIS